MPRKRAARPRVGLARELRRGTLELLLLSLLEERPKYGYELVSELEERSGGLELKEGTVYPVLYRLEDQGHIAPEWSKPDRGVPRKYYRLTNTGHVRKRHLEDEWRSYRDHVDRLLDSTRKEGS